MNGDRPQGDNLEPQLTPEERHKLQQDTLAALTQETKEEREAIEALRRVKPPADLGAQEMITKLDAQAEDALKLVERHLRPGPADVESMLKGLDGAAELDYASKTSPQQTAALAEQKNKGETSERKLGETKEEFLESPGMDSLAEGLESKQAERLVKQLKGNKRVYVFVGEGKKRQRQYLNLQEITSDNQAVFVFYDERGAKLSKTVTVDLGGVQYRKWNKAKRVPEGQTFYRTEVGDMAGAQAAPTGGGVIFNLEKEFPAIVSEENLIQYQDKKGNTAYANRAPERPDLLVQKPGGPRQPKPKPARSTGETELNWTSLYSESSAGPPAPEQKPELTDLQKGYLQQLADYINKADAYHDLLTHFSKEDKIIKEARRISQFAAKAKKLQSELKKNPKAITQERLNKLHDAVLELDRVYENAKGRIEKNSEIKAAKDREGPAEQGVFGVLASGAKLQSKVDVIVGYMNEHVEPLIADDDAWEVDDPLGPDPRIEKIYQRLVNGPFVGIDDETDWEVTDENRDAVREALGIKPKEEAGESKNASGKAKTQKLNAKQPGLVRQFIDETASIGPETLAAAKTAVSKGFWQDIGEEFKKADEEITEIIDAHPIASRIVSASSVVIAGLAIFSFWPVSIVLGPVGIYGGYKVLRKKEVLSIEPGEEGSDNGSQEIPGSEAKDLSEEEKFAHQIKRARSLTHIITALSSQGENFGFGYNRDELIDRVKKVKADIRRLRNGEVSKQDVEDSIVGIINGTVEFGKGFPGYGNLRNKVLEIFEDETKDFTDVDEDENGSEIEDDEAWSPTEEDMAKIDRAQTALDLRNAIVLSGLTDDQKDDLKQRMRETIFPGGFEPTLDYDDEYKKEVAATNKRYKDAILKQAGEIANIVTRELPKIIQKIAGATDWHDLSLVISRSAEFSALSLGYILGSVNDIKVGSNEEDGIDLEWDPIYKAALEKAFKLKAEESERVDHGRQAVEDASKPEAQPESLSEQLKNVHGIDDLIEFFKKNKTVDGKPVGVILTNLQNIKSPLISQEGKLRSINMIESKLPGVGLKKKLEALVGQEKTYEQSPATPSSVTPEVDNQPAQEQPDAGELESIKQIKLDLEERVEASKVKLLKRSWKSLLKGIGNSIEDMSATPKENGWADIKNRLEELNTKIDEATEKQKKDEADKARVEKEKAPLIERLKTRLQERKERVKKLLFSEDFNNSLQSDFSDLEGAIDMIKDGDYEGDVLAQAEKAINRGALKNIDEKIDAEIKKIDDAYEKLDLPKDVTFEVARKKYRVLAMQKSSDRGGHDAEFAPIADAWKVLQGILKVKK